MRSSAFLLPLVAAVLLAALPHGSVQAAIAQQSGMVIRPVTPTASPTPSPTVTPTVTPTVNPEVIASQMQLAPAAYTGPCDETAYGLRHTVSAMITVSEPTTVKYVWVNSQNVPWPGPDPVSVTFDAPGSRTVTNNFFSTTSLKGTMRLRVVEPANIAETHAAAYDTVCVKSSVSDVSKERTDEGECAINQPAVFALSGKLTVTDGPASIGYRWYRRSNATSNQWVYLGGDSTSFTSSGAQVKTITSRYSTTRSETGYFKVELTSPYQGLGQTSFIVTCLTKDDL